MNLAEEVDVGSSLPLPRPLVLLQHSPVQDLRTVTLLRDKQLGSTRVMMSLLHHWRFRTYKHMWIVSCPPGSLVENSANTNIPRTSSGKSTFSRIWPFCNSTCREARVQGYINLMCGSTYPAVNTLVHSSHSHSFLSLSPLTLLTPPHLHVVLSLCLQLTENAPHTERQGVV